MSLKTFLLLIVILIFGVFIYLKLESLGNDSSTFNQTTRFRLGKFSFFRTVLGLHKDGDSRAEYLQKTGPIFLEVVQPAGNSLPSDVIEAFAQKITEYTNRKVVIFQDGEITSGYVNNAQLDGIVREKRNHFEPGASNIFVMYVNDFSGSEQTIARTYQDYGIVMSHDRLLRVVSEYPNSLPEYQLSTLVHEFGHQIGLDHNSESGCLMNSAVESPNGAVGLFGFRTPTSFCDFELNQLKNIKQSF